MKAYEAKALVYRTNQKLNGIKEINRLIEIAAMAGNFRLSTKIEGSWGSVYELKDYYEEQGYKVEIYYERTGPNDSDDGLSLSWA